ncbi:MAG: pyridoxamine 5'-phosphate oxidase [Saprospiraceae bacterium]|nr:pyridoxamine 5'-phosphate oxidase [Saprospiraceae bacterium]
MDNLADLRQSYEKHSLLESDVHPDPFVQFSIWLKAAIEDERVPEANAMVLSTASLEGRPASRVVLLKNILDGKLVFYTNYESAKGKAIAQNRWVSCNFWWGELQRQVRINGTATKVGWEVSDQYFQSRPKGSQIGAIASPQSQVVSDRSYLDQRLDEVADDVEKGGDLKRPAHWGGYGIEPESFEFWQGRQNRMHDRLRYRKENDQWILERLAP